MVNITELVHIDDTKVLECFVIMHQFHCHRNGIANANAIDVVNWHRVHDERSGGIDKIKIQDVCIGGESIFLIETFIRVEIEMGSEVGPFGVQ